MEAEASVAIERYPAVFRWTGAGEDVSLSGSFNNWRTKIPLVKSHGEFYTVVEVCEGTHQYKYFVDGRWICHPNEPKVDNGMGSQNNVITIKGEDCDIYQILASDSLGAVAADPMATPPGSYSQYMPSKDAGLGFHRVGPPLLPAHLLQTVLNKEVPVHCDPTMVPEPNHVVLNHLFTLSIKGGVMVLGMTHRYRKKYITTLLYKPI
jgi:5'-AMP-activated protein kinase regulatory beta subunit